MGPLSGIRVLDMSAVLMGPLATQTLGDYGADVIKVEAPAGDVLRQVGPMRNPGMGPLYMNANRSKRAICLNVKTPEGMEALKRLIKASDIFVFNFRQSAMKRLGLEYETVREINPRIVYAGLCGFGEGGAYDGKPAYDDLIQGAAGVAHLQSRTGGGVPRYAPNAMADRIVGISAAGAILAALVHRERTGEGQRLEIPMFETMAGFTLGDHLGGLSFEPPLDDGGYKRLFSPSRKPLQTADGYICTLIYADDQWERLMEATGQPAGLANDGRFKGFAGRQAHFDELYARLDVLFQERRTQDWIAILEEADIPVLPMHDLDSLIADPHLNDVGFIEEYDHPSEGRMRRTRVPPVFHGTPAGEHRHAPVRGEHTAEILSEAGFNADEVQTMLAVGTAQAAPDRGAGV
jgi:crotonobetainyl-CoA:carnitine CoA-transferase CaiB-like acyl-CoA transferase